MQGEGRLVGVPTLFIRVSGCNLRCTWCDTPYASWQPEGAVLEVDHVLEEAISRPVRHVVLTGGEPLLFEPVVALCSGLREAGKHITIETAGTVFRDLECDLMSISPKLANSTPVGDPWEERHEANRFQPDVLRALVRRYSCQFKFVIDPDRDLLPQLEEVDDVLRAAGADRGDVLLMAEGTDANTLTRRERALVPVCIERGFRLSQRYHVTLFGNTKGT